MVVKNVWTKWQQRYKAKPNLGKDLAMDISAKNNQKFSPQSDKPQGGLSWENVLSILESSLTKVKKNIKKEEPTLPFPIFEMSELSIAHILVC